MSPLVYLALGALAVAIIFGLSTDVRAAARRLFPLRRQTAPLADRETRTGGSDPTQN